MKGTLDDNFALIRPSTFLLSFATRSLSFSILSSIRYARWLLYLLFCSLDYGFAN